MIDGQVMALCVMFLVGFVGLAWTEQRNSPKKLRIAGLVWAVAWWLPPLTLLWIKGVFG